MIYRIFKVDKKLDPEEPEVATMLACDRLWDINLSVYELVKTERFNSVNIDELIEYINCNVMTLNQSDIIEIEPELHENVYYEGDRIEYPHSFLVLDYFNEYRLVAVEYSMKQWKDYFKLN